MNQMVADFAVALKAIDERRPQAKSQRSGRVFQPGIGPFAESKAVEMVLAEMGERNQERYGDYSLSVPYPLNRRTRCDLCIGIAPEWEWAIEVKLLRFLGDNGKRNDNILKHVLSPFYCDHSSLTDCGKLLDRGLAGRKGILIYGYECGEEEYSLDVALEAFELLARHWFLLGPRCEAPFTDLVHPVHASGRVFGWEVLERARATGAGGGP